MKKYKGIDVSLWQGNIDWEDVKADGVSFVMIKASQGRTAEYDAPFTDPRFHEYAKGAEAAGLYWGVYHYLCARNEAEARAEAEYFVNLVKPYKQDIQLWAAVDVEDNATVGALSHGELTRIVQIFCDTVKAAGLRPMVYSNTNWLEWAKKFTAPAGVLIWQAHYGRDDHPDGAKIWQYSGTGKVDGIAGAVDLNEAYDIIGDVNSDGKVNISDVSALMRSLAGWKDAIDGGQADVNSDDRVTVSDAAALLRIIAGWL